MSKNNKNQSTTPDFNQAAFNIVAQATEKRLSPPTLSPSSCQNLEGEVVLKAVKPGLKPFRPLSERPLLKKLLNHAGKNQSNWFSYPFPRFISWAEMLIEFNPVIFTSLIALLKSIEEQGKALKRLTGDSTVPHLHLDTIKKQLSNTLPLLKKICSDQGMKESADSLQDIIYSFERVDLYDTSIRIGSTVLLIYRQLEERYFFGISTENSDLYQKEFTFGTDGLIEFQVLNNDMAEAAKCYALGRCTASVFHSMRALEVCLKALAAYLKIPDFKVDLPSWTAVETKVKEEIEVLHTSTKTKKANEELKFLGEISNEFTNFRIAYRNYLTHGKEEYGHEKAKKIKDSVSDFLGRLLEEINKNG